LGCRNADVGVSLLDANAQLCKIGKIIYYIFPKSAESWIVFKNKYFDEQKSLKDFIKSSILRDPKRLHQTKPLDLA
jgi:hypothetical protein